jgi:hypothetical protein
MASPLPSNILIIGATGAIGRHITDAIVTAEPPIAQRVSILTSPETVSNPAKQDLLSSWTARGLTVLTGDLGNIADVTKAYDGVDTVISCLGRGAILRQIKLLELAEQSQSVQWFFPSEYGTDIEYDASSANEIPHQGKLEVRKFIREHVSRVKCTYLVTGPYIDMFVNIPSKEPEAGGFDVSSRRAVVVGSGDDPVGFTSMPE